MQTSHVHCGKDRLSHQVENFGWVIFDQFVFYDDGQKSLKGCLSLFDILMNFVLLLITF